MAKSNNQKGKILYVERLMKETGEDHVATMQDILSYLQDKGIRAERKSIYDDMEVLRSLGMDIRFRRGRPGGYYLAGASPEGPEERRTDQPVSTGESMESNPQIPEPEHAEILQATGWKAGDTGAGTGTWQSTRAVKLLCVSREATDLAERYFDGEIQVKEREDGMYQVSAQVQEGPDFYGWLTAVGIQIRLVKPRKMIQTYREYLKNLSREYKQIP